MKLTPEVQSALLAVARQAIMARLDDRPWQPAAADYPDALQTPAGCFVSLHQANNHDLRGCIGCLEARQSLLGCVAEHAVACAFTDPRFAPLRREEVDGLTLEVSVLSPMEVVASDAPEQLLDQLTPNIHGLLLEQGGRRATFLPQVWQSLPKPEAFLQALLRKGRWLAWPEGGFRAWRYTVSHVSGPLS